MTNSYSVEQSLKLLSWPSNSCSKKVGLSFFATQRATKIKGSKRLPTPKICILKNKSHTSGK